MANEEQTQNGAVPDKSPVNDIEARLSEKDKRIAGLNRTVNKMQKQLSEANKRGESMDTQYKEMEMAIAKLTDQIAVDGGNEASAVKTLAEKRAKPETQAENPDVTRFLDMLEDEGLKVDFDSLEDPDRTDPIVGEALKDSQSPREAYRIVRARLKEESKAIITEGIQRGLKENGATQQGVTQPTTAQGYNITRENLGKVTLENVDEYAKVKTQFDQAIREGKLN